MATATGASRIRALIARCSTLIEVLRSLACIGRFGLGQFGSSGVINAPHLVGALPRVRVVHRRFIDRLFKLSRWGLRICEVRHEDPLADYPRGGRGERWRGLSGPKQQL